MHESHEDTGGNTEEGQSDSLSGGEIVDVDEGPWLDDEDVGQEVGVGKVV